MAAISIPGMDAMRQRDIRWYLHEYESTRAKKLADLAKALWRADYGRREEYRKFAALYGNLPLLGFSSRTRLLRNTGSTGERLSLNVVRSCVDSFTAKLTNERPMVACATFKGDWDMQQRAEMLQSFIAGTFNAPGPQGHNVYSTSRLAALDMGVFGTGTVKIYSDDRGGAEHLCIDRIKPWHSFVDAEEASDGDASCRYERRWIDRLKAMAEYPEAAERIATVKRSEEDEEEREPDNLYTDTVCLTEGFHLPSCAGAGDGRHTIICGDVIVFDEAWDKPYFPYVDLVRQRPQSGIWGTGLADELEGIQWEINFLLNVIRRAMRMSGSLRWMIENGSNVNTQYISDIIGSMIRYSGTPPEPITPPAVAQEVYQHLDRLYQRAYEITGISQLSSMGVKPAGADSGKSLQVLLDTESERFSVAFNEYHNFYLRMARQVITLAREVGERNKAFAVKALGKGKMLDVVKWADVHLDEDKYELEMQEANAFSRTPSARLQQVIDLTNSGTLDPKTGRRMMGSLSPDIEEENSYEYASYNLTMSMIDSILKDGEKGFQPPEPFLDLADAVKRFTAAYCKARMSKVPEDRLELLRRWIQMAQDMSQPPPPQQPPQGPPPANGNGAPPMSGAA
jgi:hypothetical protein